MRRWILMLLVLGLAVSLAVPAFCEEPERFNPNDDYGYGRGRGHMKGAGR